MNTQNTPGPHVYRPDIDGLRAVAVLAVVFYHAFHARLKAGFVGVDIFFVISGYLICGIILHDLHRGTFSIWNFYNRRIRRIFPALIVVLAATLILGWFVLLPEEYRSLGKYVFGGASFSANFFLWQEAGYFDVAAKSKPLLHLWSLGIEEQFYIVFPLLLYCCAKKQLDLIKIIVALCLASFLYNLYCREYPVENFYSPLTRAWELLAGAALCAFMRQASAKELVLKLDALLGKVLKQENDGRSLSLMLALFGVILLTLALLLARETGPYPGWQALLPVSGTMLLIAATPPNPISTYLLANRVAVFIGLVSYPLYLWHWVLISYAYIINGGLDESTLLLRVGLVVVSFILAVLTYLLLEKPIRFGGRARTAKTVGLIIGMVVVGMAGLSVYLMHGVTGREHRGEKEARIMEQLLTLYKTVDEEGLAYAGIAKGMTGYCRYTDAGAGETVAIIGDSHAWAAYPGVAQLGLESGYNTVLLGMIIPAGEMYYQVLSDAQNNQKEIYKNISKETDVIFDILRKKDDIRKVFIFDRGTVYITGVLQYNLGKNCDGVGYESFKESLQSYVDTLRGYGKEVFIVAELPELPALVGDYIDRPFRMKKGEFPDVHKSEVVKRQEKYLQLLSEIKNATIINTIEQMCPEENCMVFTEEGLPMYRDHDHLSPAGSKFQAERILKPYLTGKK